MVLNSFMQFSTRCLTKFSTFRSSTGWCFNARRYGPVSVTSVRPSVCPSQAVVLLKRLNIASYKHEDTIAEDSDAKDLDTSPMAAPSTGVRKTRGVEKICDFRQITRYIS